MSSTPGVDYPWSHPGGAALQKAGIKFACRYLSHDSTKNISRAEADDLADHGVATVVVWESTNNRALSGHSGGAADATTALAQAKAAGMPTGRPVFMAVDFDPTTAQMPTVMAYLDGAASVLGEAHTGVYGGYRTVKAALDGGHVHWAWQTAAWSGGKWDARAVLRQPATTIRINGVACDNDTALTADFGQWTPGRNPTPLEDPLPTPADVWSYSHGDHPDVHQTLADAATQAKAAADGVKTLAGKVGTVALTDAQLTALAGKLAASPVLAAAIAEQVAVKLAARLQS